RLCTAHAKTGLIANNRPVGAAGPSSRNGVDHSNLPRPHVLACERASGRRQLSAPTFPAAVTPGWRPFVPLVWRSLMNANHPSARARRDLLKNAGRVAAASALAGVTLPAVHAGENHTLRIALVGCGGRGTGAAINALASPQGPCQLVAMADVFPDRLQ